MFFVLVHGVETATFPRKVWISDEIGRKSSPWEPAMANKGGVNLTKQGNVFIMKLESDENRITVPFVKAVHQVLDTVERSSTGAAALVTIGTGKFFSNGVYLTENRNNPQAAQELSVALYSMLSRILVFPIPTIACINGHAFGAGLMLALAHDYRLMNSQRGWACIPVVDVGIILPKPLIELFKSKVGNPSIARQMILGGERLNGTECLARGIVDEILSEDKLLDGGIALAGKLSPKGSVRECYTAMKRNLYANAYEKFSTNTDFLQFLQPKL